MVFYKIANLKLKLCLHSSSAFCFRQILRRDLPANAIFQHYKFASLNLRDNQRYSKAMLHFCMKQIMALLCSPHSYVNLCEEVSNTEMTQSIHNMKCGKAPGPDNIHPEFIKNLGSSDLKWLAAFFSICMRLNLLPKIWRKANIIAMLKPSKDAKVPKSYRLISLLCVPFKNLERMILSRITPYAEKCLPDFQAGFRAGRSTIDQVLQLCSIIEDGFQLKQKTALALFDLTAAYNTVWHQNLRLKLLRTIPDKHLVAFIMKTLSNRRFVLRTSDGQESRARHLKNRVPQGSILAPCLFNIYISDSPKTLSTKLAYADDLALAFTGPDWADVENAMNRNLSTLNTYYHQNRLQLSKEKLCMPCTILTHVTWEDD